MDITSEFRADASAITDLFVRTFSASEGPEEGRAVGALAADLMATTGEDDLRVYVARNAEGIAGCIMFSRLTFAGDDRTVFLLSPVAVDPALQGRGVGQRLLRHGLDDLRARGVDVAVTYGDPAYYGKVGFSPVTEAKVPAPMPLSHPHGWIAQSLTERPLDPLRGPSRCVTALGNPAIW